MASFVDEKQRLDDPVQPTPGPIFKKVKTALQTTQRILGLIWLVWGLVWCVQRWYAKPGDVAPIRYAGESLTWEACGEIDGHRVECTSLDTPMDHFDKQNSGDKTFTIPIIRMRAHNATQSLFLNPGGPGGSGVDFLRGRGQNLSTIIGEGFHLLSFDPRGVGASQPSAECYPVGVGRSSSCPAHDKHIVIDSPEIWASSINHAQACVDNMGEHGRYINTPQTAADMNSILDALGQRDMAYWGFSYGTLLGQTYASLFPERSARVIIDGVVNFREWYEDKFYYESLMDTDNVFRGFVDQCLKAGSACALSALAESPEELGDKLRGFAENLKSEPISVYVNSTVNGVIDQQTVWYNAIFPAMYAPLRWPALADNLAKLLQGNATGAYLAYGVGSPFESGNGSASNEFVCMNDGVSGAEQWPVDREELLAEIINYVNSTSSFAAFENSGFYARRAWSVPKTHSFVPPKNVQTAHPLLILSTTYDPVCPLRSAQAARGIFEDSRLIEVKGYGHCSIAIPSLCMAKHVRAFLNEGTLPEEDTTCERDGEYFTQAEELAVQAEMLGYDSEERRISEAQVVVAQEMEWARLRF